MKKGNSSTIDKNPVHRTQKNTKLTKNELEIIRPNKTKIFEKKIQLTVGLVSSLCMRDILFVVSKPKFWAVGKFSKNLLLVRNFFCQKMLNLILKTIL